MALAPPLLTIEQYAALQVALAGAPDRDTVLARFGLTETSFAAEDQRFQCEIERALDETTDSVPPVVAAYDKALRDARGSLEAPPLTLEQFAAVTAELSIVADPRPVLDRRGVGFDAYLRSSQYWASRLASDPELAKRFRQLSSGSTDPD